ncbi:Oidioi.mRNA.OKI2018_I69.chr1.g2417.t1.cds [Oikopleura dioica]|uniref:Oidioi.mRNA.OKI2018_I69.chr1.g2417.t1.cds n=1 Tax=Oikopleura dioica TaxID=34765 RepID=A0ABN7SXE2_OIKDI|nr:Oidioi.mRNA.OKI2018_I69.chr1.g2417.t1.cds [Oikopleura dioica]
MRRILFYKNSEDQTWKILRKKFFKTQIEAITLFPRNFNESDPIKSEFLDCQETRSQPWTQTTSCAPKHFPLIRPSQDIDSVNIIAQQSSLIRGRHPILDETDEKSICRKRIQNDFPLYQGRYDLVAFKDYQEIFGSESQKVIAESDGHPVFRNQNVFLQYIYDKASPHVKNGAWMFFYLEATDSTVHRYFDFMVTSIDNYSNFTPKDLIGKLRFHVINHNVDLDNIFIAENGWLDCGENDIFYIE